MVFLLSHLPGAESGEVSLCKPWVPLSSPGASAGLASSKSSVAMTNSPACGVTQLRPSD